MDIALFVGCVAPLRYPGIESSTREVLKRLGITVHELNGASCCPAPGVTRSFDQTAWVGIAARNIALAERKGLDILTVCNGCFGSLFESAYLLGEKPELLREVNGILGKLNMTVTPHGVEIRHFAEGYYGLTTFRLPSKSVELVKDRLNLDEDFLRFQVVARTE